MKVVALKILDQVVPGCFHWERGLDGLRMMANDKTEATIEQWLGIGKN